MRLVRLDPFRDLISIRERMDRLFDQTLSRTKDKEGGLLVSSWAPAVDIYETEDRVVLKAELPGVGKDNVNIQIQDNTLTLKGERRIEKGVKEENFLRMERAYGAFHRSFYLPVQVQKDKVKAIFRDGVLEVILLKAEEAKPKHIKVEVK